jgi:RsiW-degrading membrane proteinase PrsW (M82 family)
MDSIRREMKRRPGRTFFRGPARWTTTGINPLIFYGLFIGLSALGLYLQLDKHLGAATGKYAAFYRRAWLVSCLVALVLAAVVLFLDRYEREPWKLLLVAFVWGAVGSRAILWPAGSILEQLRHDRIEHHVNKTVRTYIKEHSIEIPKDLIWGTEADRARGIEETEGVVEVVINQVERSSIGPFLEELSKAFILFFLFLLLPHEFDGVLDGLLYGVLVGLGFAMVENVRYFFELQVELARGVSYVESFGEAVILRLPGYPGHALLAGLSGVGLGLAQTARRELQRWLAPPLGFALA